MPVSFIKMGIYVLELINITNYFALLKCFIDSKTERYANSTWAEGA
jgi:hypothetical protein